MVKRMIIVLFVNLVFCGGAIGQNKKNMIRGNVKQVTKSETLHQDKRERIMLVYKFDDTELCIDSIEGTQYYVIPFPKKTAHELYSMVYQNAASLFMHPEKVISGTPGEFLLINGSASKIDKTLVYKDYYQYLNLTFRIEILFKDGRIRVNIPQILDMFYGLEDGEQHYLTTKAQRYVYYMMNTHAIENILFFFDYIANTLVYGDLTKIDNEHDNDW